MVVTQGSTVSWEKPTVKLYTYINRHAGTPNKINKGERHDERGLHLNVTLGLGIGWVSHEESLQVMGLERSILTVAILVYHVEMK